MRKTLIIIGITLIILIIVLKLTSKDWMFLLGTKPRNPKYEIPITYNIGWWSNQKALHIDTFEVELIESKLNLFNSYSLINYRIKGKLVLDTKNWVPYIDRIHISERIMHSDTVDSDSTNVLILPLKKGTFQIGDINIKPEAIIELTPIVKLKENKTYKSGQVIDFDVTNEHKIQSLHWGNNFLLLKCGQFNIPVILQQTK